MHKHYQVFSIAVVAILAWSSYVFRGTYFSRTVANGDDQHRSLRLNQYLATTAPRSITVYLIAQRGRPNPAYSFFQTDILQRYASGRVDFIIEANARCGSQSCTPTPNDQSWKDHPAPCLTVSKAGACTHQLLQCQYPQCKHMVTNDETCKARLYDVRQYYSANMPGKGYLPLGPRLDSWTSFQKHQQDPTFFIAPSSERKYVFNAIFSKNTNSGRASLANIIEAEDKKFSMMDTYVSIAKEWHPQANNPETQQVNTDQYMEIVLSSVFTLSPAGHNPECFRIFEAVEAGSIPVLVKNDLVITRQHPCRDALYHWYDAPILVLDSWSDLYPAMEKLMADSRALNEMQVKLRVWYDEYMKQVVGEFEDVMLNAYEEVEDLILDTSPQVLDTSTQDASLKLPLVHSIRSWARRKKSWSLIED